MKTLKKSLRFLAAFWITASMFSCDKPEEVNEVPSKWIRGEGGANFNSKNWEPYSIVTVSPKSKDNGSFYLVLSLRNQFDILIEDLGFSDVPLRQGEYKLYKELIPYDSVTSASFGFMDDDLILKSYFVVEQDSTNFVSVDAYNAVSGEISGRFSVTMAHFQAHTSEFPDTLYFRNGWYKTTISR
jgi:hypothetical protein